MTEANMPRARARAADIAYDTFYAGAVGGSIVALFFLFFDIAGGHPPLFTPNLIGSVLFLGADPLSDPGIRYEIVALFALIHFAGFALIGLLVALADQAFKLHQRTPVAAVVSVFLVNLLCFGGAAVFVPGLIARIGAPFVVGANVLAAIGMMLAVAYGHRRGAERAVARAEDRAQQRREGTLGVG